MSKALLAQKAELRHVDAHVRPQFEANQDALAKALQAQKKALKSAETTSNFEAVAANEDKLSQLLQDQKSLLKKVAPHERKRLERNQDAFATALQDQQKLLAHVDAPDGSYKASERDAFLSSIKGPHDLNKTAGPRAHTEGRDAVMGQVKAGHKLKKTIPNERPKFETAMPCAGMDDLEKAVGYTLHGKSGHTDNKWKDACAQTVLAEAYPSDAAFRDQGGAIFESHPLYSEISILPEKLKNALQDYLKAQAQGQHLSHDMTQAAEAVIHQNYGAYDDKKESDTPDRRDAMLAQIKKGHGLRETSGPRAYKPKGRDGITAKELQAAKLYRTEPAKDRHGDKVGRVLAFEDEPCQVENFPDALNTIHLKARGYKACIKLVDEEIASKSGPLYQDYHKQRDYLRGKIDQFMADSRKGTTPDVLVMRPISKFIHTFGDAPAAKKVTPNPVEATAEPEPVPRHCQDGLINALWVIDSQQSASQVTAPCRQLMRAAMAGPDEKVGTKSAKIKHEFFAMPESLQEKIKDYFQKTAQHRGANTALYMTLRLEIEQALKAAHRKVHWPVYAHEEVPVDHAAEHAKFIEEQCTTSLTKALSYAAGAPDYKHRQECLQDLRQMLGVDGTPVMKEFNALGVPLQEEISAQFVPHSGQIKELYALAKQVPIALKKVQHIKGKGWPARCPKHLKDLMQDLLHTETMPDMACIQHIENLMQEADVHNLIYEELHEMPKSIQAALKEFVKMKQIDPHNPLINLRLESAVRDYQGLTAGRQSLDQRTYDMLQQKRTPHGWKGCPNHLGDLMQALSSPATKLHDACFARAVFYIDHPQFNTGIRSVHHGSVLENIGQNEIAEQFYGLPENVQVPFLAWIKSPKSADAKTAFERALIESQGGHVAAGAIPEPVVKKSIAAERKILQRRAAG